MSYQSAQIYLGNVRLLDGTGGPVPSESYALLIAGRTIAAVAPQHELNCPPEALSFDLHGITVMPGLIDCHDHLADLEGSMQQRAAVPLLRGLGNRHDSPAGC